MDGICQGPVKQNCLSPALSVPPRTAKADRLLVDTSSFPMQQTSLEITGTCVTWSSKTTRVAYGLDEYDRMNARVMTHGHMSSRDYSIDVDCSHT